MTHPTGTAWTFWGENFDIDFGTACNRDVGPLCHHRRLCILLKERTAADDWTDGRIWIDFFITVAFSTPNETPPRFKEHLSRRLA